MAAQRSLGMVQNGSEDPTYRGLITPDPQDLGDSNFAYDGFSLGAMSVPN